MPALSVVSAGGEADLTDLPCSRTPAPSLSPGRRRRRPSAARSLLRNPPVRASCACGASSGRRVMAPASLHNNLEAGACDAGLPRSTARPAPEDPSLSPSGSVALPPLRPQHAESQDRAGRRPGTAPARLLDPAATYNTTLTALRSTDRPASACSCAADRAEFAPARPIAGGSGGRSQRSSP